MRAPSDEKIELDRSSRDIASEEIHVSISERDCHRRDYESTDQAQLQCGDDQLRTSRTDRIGRYVG